MKKFNEAVVRKLVPLALAKLRRWQKQPERPVKREELSGGPLPKVPRPAWPPLPKGKFPLKVQ